jgi:hypothetical protein
VATAVYVVVVVGVSCAVPDVCDPLTTLRLEEPSDAVIVTDVALNACQFSVTLCPLLIEPVLAEKVMVGATFFELLAHDEEPQITAIRAPQKIQRNAW